MRQTYHARTNTHTHNTQLAALSLQPMHKRARHPRASGTQRVSQRDRAPIWVHLVQAALQPQLAHAVQRLARKRLVDLPPVDVLGREAQLRQQLRNRQRGADAHLVRRAAHGGGANKLANDAAREPELRRRAPPHQQRRRRAVADLARVAGRRRAVGLERGLELREPLDACIRADPVVLRHRDLLLRADLVPLLVDLLEARGHGDNLLRKLAAGPRAGGAQVAFDGKGVLVGAADAVARGDVLRGQAHGHDAVAGVLDGAVFERGPGVDGDGARGVVARHALHAGADADVDHAGADLAGHGGDGLETGGAGAVDGVQRGGVGVADVVHGHAGGLGAAQLGEHDADGDVVDLGGVEGRVRVEGRAQDHREELFRIGVLQRAAVGAADGRAQGGEDHGVGGGFGEDGAEAFGEGDGHRGRAAAWSDESQEARRAEDEDGLVGEEGGFRTGQLMGRILTIVHSSTADVRKGKRKQKENKKVVAAGGRRWDLLGNVNGRSRKRAYKLPANRQLSGVSSADVGLRRWGVKEIPALLRTAQRQFGSARRYYAMVKLCFKFSAPNLACGP